ncbi:retinol-binding protein pinta [Anabrus simplex]|uniref:retinol-binding protein pinta n=1 Tax=Anabrus simplex TaxID=316456 RepID=UPI0034DD965E
MKSGVRPLTPELEEVARKTINEVPDRRDEDLLKIKEWLEKQTHIKARTDDQFLIIFLRACKFSLERTKEKIDTYYAMRSALPEFFTNRDPLLPELQAVMDTACQFGLSDIPEGGPLWFWRLSNYDPKTTRIEDIIKVMFMMEETILLEEDSALVCGQHIFIDLAGVTMAHMLQFSPVVLKKFLQVWQVGYPTRPQQIHIVNIPSFFETLLNFVRSMLKEKLRKRLFFHTNIDSLKNEGLKAVLPEEYGGKSKSIKELGAIWKAKVESYRDYYLEDEKYGVDESKRPGRPKTTSELFGTEGSFRHLQLD